MYANLLKAYISILLDGIAEGAGNNHEKFHMLHNSLLKMWQDLLFFLNLCRLNFLYILGYPPVYVCIYV